MPNLPGYPTVPSGGGLLGRLGSLFQRKYGAPSAPQRQSTVPEFQDPIVANLNQQLEAEQPRVPAEDEQLQREQHEAWANHDFERCIVIFSRLHELHPDEPQWVDKLKVSYFNRGKQYEAEGNQERAIQSYYAALALDASFPEAQQAAEQLLQQEEQAGTQASQAAAG
jgi:tetratricopeptide (TPR) repeat protein